MNTLSTSGILYFEKLLPNELISLDKESNAEVQPNPLANDEPNPEPPVPQSDFINARLLRPENRGKIQQHLTILLHTQKCMIRERQANGEVRVCSLPYCKIMKNVLIHMATCKQGRRCLVRFCDSSRLLLNHWEQCQKSEQQNCPLCLPLKQAFAPQALNFPTGLRPDLSTPQVRMQYAYSDNQLRFKQWVAHRGQSIPPCPIGPVFSPYHFPGKISNPPNVISSSNPSFHPSLQPQNYYHHCKSLGLNSYLPDPNLNQPPYFQPGPNTNRPPFLLPGPNLYQLPRFPPGPNMNQPPYFQLGPNMNQPPHLQPGPCMNQPPHFQFGPNMNQPLRLPPGLSMNQPPHLQFGPNRNQPLNLQSGPNINEPSHLEFQNTPKEQVKDWQLSVSAEVRKENVNSLIQAIFTTNDEESMLDDRLKHLSNYAKKVENDIYEMANSELEYNQLLIDKVVSSRIAIEDRRRKRESLYNKRPAVVANKNLPSTSTENEAPATPPEIPKIPQNFPLEPANIPTANLNDPLLNIPLMYQKYAQPEPAKVTKGWHSELMPDLRKHLIMKMIKVVCPASIRVTVYDARIKNLCTYAKKIEAEKYELANSKSQYMQSLAEKICQTKLELDKKRQEYMESQRRRQIGNNSEQGASTSSVANPDTMQPPRAEPN